MDKQWIDTEKSPIELTLNTALSQVSVRSSSGYSDTQIT